MQQSPKASNAPDHLQHYFEACRTLAKDIASNHDKLLKLLCKYETHETVQDEIERSISALNGMEQEFASIKKPLNGLTVATFFPVNLPLYSFVLFGIAPSAFSRNVFIRPPEVMTEVLEALDSTLNLLQRFPAIKVKATPRRTFMDLYANEADAIIFTGKYENAMAIHDRCPQALLLYNGSGINPFVIFKNADLSKAAAKAVEMRCFNSGQDCAGTDAFFVPKSLADDFVAKLKAELKAVKVGPSTDPEVRISRTIKESYLLEIQEWLTHEKPHIVHGGEIEVAKGYVHPTIIRKPASAHQGEFHEFFAPVFYVLEYNDVDELEQLLLSNVFTEKTMYITVFGDEPTIEKQLTYAKILKNKIINDVEQGNEEYGGWGPKSNFLLYGDNKVVKPVLISRDLHEMLG